MRRTVPDILAMKARGERIAMLTVYDYSMARALDAAGVPILFIGDTLGMVVLGYNTTLPVSVDDIIRHTQAVVRGSERALIVADLPFMSYQATIESALRNAARLLQEGGAQAVKLEGGRTVVPQVRAMVDVGIPVMGHVGLTPQAINQLGGNRVQGRSLEAARELLADAQALEEAGCFGLVLELVSAPLATFITRRLSIPTIGIGAGAGCDGQVQVLYDLLGLFPDFQPRHARRYAELGAVIREAAERYMTDVQTGSFPTDRESFAMDAQVIDELQRTTVSTS